MDEVFHRGERALQARAGLRARFSAIGPQLIRDAMPDAHRAFFAELPMLFVASLDAHGQPWASVLAGAAGFVQAPDAYGVRIEGGLDAHDPLRARLTPAAPIGVLGLQPEARRRNRANGWVRAVDPERLELEIAQSFGNCPKHIHPRRIALERPGPVRWSNAQTSTGVLAPEALALVAHADTFFIASSSSAAPRVGGEGEGLDVSHRGGPAGFVTHALHAGRSVLSAPDYAGNFFFNTLGNLSLHPHAGLLFLDFERGALVAIATDVVIDERPQAVQHHPGAERVLHFQVREACFVPDALPFRGVSLARGTGA